MITKEQKIINEVAEKLPIKVFPQPPILPKLREIFPGATIKIDSILEIHRMFDGGDEAGIACEVRPVNYDLSKAQSVILSSITQFRIKVGEPHFEELQDYITKRVKKLQKQNRGLTFMDIPRRK
jgi:hypothetical protein